MYAIIKVAGLQRTVKKGDTIKVNRLASEAGSQITINEVLAVSKDNNLVVGTPFVKNAQVIAKVVDHLKDKKVIIFKKNRRHNYRKKVGFRQPITKVEIIDIK